MKTENLAMKTGMMVSFTLLFISIFAVSCGGRTPKSDAVIEQAERSAVEIEQTIEIEESTLIDKGVDTVKMGFIRSGEVKSKRIEIVNAGERSFAILSVDKSCGCVDFDYPRRPMKAGERFETDMLFDSKGENGRVLKTVRITTSLGTKQFLLVVTAEIG